MGLNGLPIIQSNQTGNFWLISWDTLVRLALCEGIERNDISKLPKKPTTIPFDG